MDCLFCKIVNREIPAEIVYEDSDFLAFKDINPEAKVHILVIPKKHIDTIADLNEENIDLYGKILLVAQKVAQEQGIIESGFRSVINCNNDSGMEVKHLHIHILGGEKLGKIC